MDKVKINKGRMYHSSDLVLDKFADSFANIEELAQAHQELKGYIGIIDEEQQVQVVDHTGLTRTKIALRADVTRQIQKFSMALKAIWTNYSGIDVVGNTNSAALGGTGGVGQDYMAIAAPRRISFGISVTF